MKDAVKTFVKSPATFLIVMLLFVLVLLFVLRFTSRANQSVHVEPEATSVGVVEVTTN